MTNQTAAELIALQAGGQASAVEIADAFLAAIRDREPKLHAFLYVDEAAVRARAAAIDGKRKAGQPLGKLAGVPVAVKDVLCTKGVRTTCGSRMLANFVPPYDAHVIERLIADDAVILGKTNMDEFAMGSSTENSAYQVTCNPWDASRIPGGSSGGSAAAVAGREVPIALGTDTGGSIRQPAALCGVVGVKPTYGRVSRYGLIAFASSLDQIGPFSRTVRDAATLLGIIAGHDPMDATSIPGPVPDYVATLERGVEALRVGVVREGMGEGTQPGVKARVDEAAGRFAAMGCEVGEVSLPSFDVALSAYYLIAPAECSSNLARYDGVRYGYRAHDPR